MTKSRTLLPGLRLVTGDDMKSVMFIVGRKGRARYFFVPKLPRKILRAARFVRGLFPSAWCALFYCCDSRRYFAGRVVVAWNAWHLRRLERELDRASDGTCVRQIPLYRALYLIATRQDRWRN